jgi:polysaccharide pyruvyl transferase CsaB
MRDYALTYPQLMSQALAAGYDTAALQALRRAFDLSEAMCDGLYRPSRAPFLCHLVRTSSIALAERAPLRVVQAALLHAAYRLDGFTGSRRRRAGTARRAQLRRSFGAEVEALLWAYQQHPWYRREAVEAHLERLAAYGPVQRAALLIRLADELEDCLDLALAYAGTPDAQPRVGDYGLACVQLAERLDHPDLARDLAEAFDQLRKSRLPEVVLLGRSLSYERPRSHLWESTLPERMLRATVRRLRRGARRAAALRRAEPEGAAGDALRPATPARILVLGGDADGNLGDRAILLSMLREARALCDELEVTLVSAEPERWGRSPGVQVVPRGARGLLRLCRAAARSDLVLCGGGGLFQDDDSLVKMPYWMLRIGLARLLCRRVVGYSLGVGPLRAASSRLSARLAFACMETISVRDPAARRLVASLTAKPARLVADPALLLPGVPAAAARDWLAAQGIPLDATPLVGFTTRRWFPARARLIPHRLRNRLPLPAREEPEAERHVELLARTLDTIAERHRARVLLLPSYNAAHEGDDRICERVRARMVSDARLLRIDDPALYKGVCAELAVMLAGRMHPALFAASAGTPVVGLAYNPKFHGLFELLGCDDRVMDVEAFVQGERVAELVELVDRALREGPASGERIAALGAEIRRFHHELAGRAA